MPISGDVYKELGRSSAGAVSVVAAYSSSAETVFALTVSSFVTLSFEPPLVMFAIQQNANSYSPMVESKAFGVSLLAAEQAHLAMLFAGKGREKSALTRFDRGRALLVPVIRDSLAQIECLSTEVVISGDHAIIMGQVEEARTRRGEPLLYFARQYGSFRPLESVASMSRGAVETHDGNG